MRVRGIEARALACGSEGVMKFDNQKRFQHGGKHRVGL
jgi:hypothetical protein